MFIINIILFFMRCAQPTADSFIFAKRTIAQHTKKESAICSRYIAYEYRSYLNLIEIISRDK